MDMTLEEQGAYRNLLDEAHLRGGAIPNDERILAKACGDALSWKRVRPAVIARFYLADGGWRNETLDEVLGESIRRAEKQRDFRAKHRKRKGNATGNAAGNATGNAEGNDSEHGAGNDASNDAGNNHGNPAQSPSPSPVCTYPEVGTASSGSSPFGRKITAAGASVPPRVRSVS